MTFARFEATEAPSVGDEGFLFPSWGAKSTAGVREKNEEVGVGSWGCGHQH